MEIDFLTVDEEQEYTDFLFHNNETSMVSSLLFRNFLQEMILDVIPYYFIVKEHKKIVGVLPCFLKNGKYGHVLNSLPWFGSNPGIIANNIYIASELLNSFINTFKSMSCFSATLIASPFDCWQEELYNKTFSKFQNCAIEQRVGSITQLPSFENENVFIEKLISQIHSKTRNQIKKSYNECFVDNTDIDFNLDFLKNTHQENMISVGAPIKEREFSMFKKWRLGVDYDVYLSREKKTNIPVAALLVSYFNKTIDYWVPAIKVEYRHLNPIHILIFELMKKSAKKGFEVWNWGGTNVPEMESVLHFKKRFGAKINTYKYYTLYNEKLLENVSKKILSTEYQYFYTIPYRLLGGTCKTM